MKRRIISLIMTVCLLLTAGCSGKSTGAASDKPIDTKKMAAAAADVSYSLKAIEEPQRVWFSQNGIARIGDKIFLLGGFLEDNYLYSINPDGTGAELIARGKTAEESWYSYCALKEDLYVYDRLNNRLIEFSKNGDRLRELKLPDDIQIESMASDGDIVYVAGGTRLYALKTGDKAKVLFDIKISRGSTLGRLPDGRCVVCWTKEQTQAISVIDPETKKLSESRYIDSLCRIIGGGEEWSLYLQIKGDVCGFDFESGTVKKLFSLSENGILYNGCIWEAGSGKLIYTGSTSHEASPPLLLEPSEESASSNGNVTLTFATLDMMPYALRDGILNWNSSHTDIKIEVRDYSVYSTESDSSGGELQLAADIAANNAPDIYNFSDFLGSALNAQSFSRKDLLEDLYPFIDSDPEMSRDDLFSSMLRLTETDGRLDFIVPGFAILSYIGQKDDVGDKENWNYDALERVVGGNDYYQHLFDYSLSREDWLQMMISASGAKLIDWKALQIHFDSEYFIHLLELSRIWPEEGELSFGTVAKLVQDSHALLYFVPFSSISNGSIPVEAYGPGNYAFVGLPEIGSVMRPQMSLGISSRSAHKEECWQFIRELLLPGAMVEGIPLRREGAQEQLDRELEQMKEYPVEHPGREEAMHDLISHIEGVQTMYQYDDAIWGIVIDEARKMYSGRADAEATAAAIQKRASIYLSEQYG